MSPLRRFTPPMSPAEAEQALALTFRPLLAVHSSYSLYGQALELTRSHSISLYDSLFLQRLSITSSRCPKLFCLASPRARPSALLWDPPVVPFRVAPSLLAFFRFAEAVLAA